MKDSKEKIESTIESESVNLNLKQKKFHGNRPHLNRFLTALQSKNPEVWNEWRKKNLRIRPDLRGIDLENQELKDFNLSSAKLSKANLSGVRAWSIRLKGADLQYADLDMAELNYADLRGANLNFSRLVAANLTMVNAEGATFRNADFSHAVLNGAQLQGADISNARVSGTSTWGIGINQTTCQSGLLVDEWVDPLEDIVDNPRASIENILVHVDHIEAAHLLYLVSTRGKFKTIIDAMTARVVLLLGNFGSRRKSILNAIRLQLANFGYAPVIFDFARPVDRDLIETVALIAGLSRFVIADLTRPKSTPLESLLIAPQLMVPFASIIKLGERPFSMFPSLQAKYEWVLPTWTYQSQKHLIKQLKNCVINPCERMREKLGKRRIEAGLSQPKKMY